MVKRIIRIYGVLLCMVLVVAPAHAQARTLASAQAEFGEATKVALLPLYAAAGISYPPKAITLVALKQERVVEVWALGATAGSWRYVHQYRMTAASGGIGPKLRRGDRQVPEGIYQVEYLNPNSRFHLSFKIDYPNAWDRLKGLQDNRPDLGDNIFFHGSFVSIGCIAIGDDAIEELFSLVHAVGRKHVSVIIAPYDLRKFPVMKVGNPRPRWQPQLHRHIQRALQPYCNNGRFCGEQP